MKCFWSFLTKENQDTLLINSNSLNEYIKFSELKVN
jgi:hypothetical protein